MTHDHSNTTVGHLRINDTMASHSTAPSQTTRSPLLALAPELRNEISELAVVEPDGITIPASGKVKLPALLAVCREVRQEAEGVYFGMNTFKSVVGFKDFSVINWFANLTERQRRLTKKISIKFSASVELKKLHCELVKALQDPDATRFTAAKFKYSELQMKEITEANIWAWGVRAIGVKVDAIHFEDPGFDFVALFLDMTPESVSQDVVQGLEATLTAMFGIIARHGAEAMMRAADTEERVEVVTEVGKAVESAGRSVGGVQSFFEHQEKFTTLRALAASGLKCLLRALPESG
ncbi:hypothetical protein Tdes44962_MAKER01567 [Teratosphaeria destructans]|uniref:Uncharacterized protein n=1 Tax=Teratosphaeria destructans TaxID=418781 RepID=A0A9W7SYA9_9PEZI|nr:hypothetical protein Tdes44962_MAKER01567 [Teratosphaeria destructans]